MKTFTLATLMMFGLACGARSETEDSQQQAEPQPQPEDAGAAQFTVGSPSQFAAPSPPIDVPCTLEIWVDLPGGTLSMDGVPLIADFANGVHEVPCGTHSFNLTPPHDLNPARVSMTWSDETLVPNPDFPRIIGNSQRPVYFTVNVGGDITCPDELRGCWRNQTTMLPVTLTMQRTPMVDPTSGKLYDLSHGQWIILGIDPTMQVEGFNLRAYTEHEEVAFYGSVLQTGIFLSRRDVSTGHIINYEKLSPGPCP